jgi:hypothetical protein
MSVKATSAPRPPGISSGAETYETRNIEPSRRKNQSRSLVTVSPVVRGQHRALGGREGRAVETVVVDRLVAVATEQLPRVGIPARRDRRPVREPDQPRCIDHPDRPFHSLQRGDKDILRNRPAAILLQRLGLHPRARLHDGIGERSKSTHPLSAG